MFLIFCRCFVILFCSRLNYISADDITFKITRSRDKLTCAGGEINVSAGTVMRAYIDYDGDINFRARCTSMTDDDYQDVFFNPNSRFRNQVFHESEGYVSANPLNTPTSGEWNYKCIIYTTRHCFTITDDNRCQSSIGYDSKTYDVGLTCIAKIKVIDDSLPSGYFSVNGVKQTTNKFYYEEGETVEFSCHKIGGNGIRLYFESKDGGVFSTNILGLEKTSLRMILKKNDNINQINCIIRNQFGNNKAFVLYLYLKNKQSKENLIIKTTTYRTTTKSSVTIKKVNKPAIANVTIKYDDSKSQGKKINRGDKANTQNNSSTKKHDSDVQKPNNRDKKKQHENVLKQNKNNTMHDSDVRTQSNIDKRKQADNVLKQNNRNMTKQEDNKLKQNNRNTTKQDDDSVLKQNRNAMEKYDYVKQPPNINMTEQNGIPLFTQDGVILGVLGMPLYLKCDAGADPINTQWYQGWSEYSKNTKIGEKSSYFEYRGLVMKISRLSLDTLGLYECQARYEGKAAICRFNVTTAPQYDILHSLKLFKTLFDWEMSN